MEKESADLKRPIIEAKTFWLSKKDDNGSKAIIGEDRTWKGKPLSIAQVVGLADALGGIGKSIRELKEKQSSLENTLSDLLLPKHKTVDVYWFKYSETKSIGKLTYAVSEPFINFVLSFDLDQWQELTEFAVGKGGIFIDFKPPILKSRNAYLVYSQTNMGHQVQVSGDPIKRIKVKKPQNSYLATNIMTFSFPSDAIEELNVKNL